MHRPGFGSRLECVLVGEQCVLPAAALPPLLKIFHQTEAFFLSWHHLILHLFSALMALIQLLYVHFPLV
jgi:hypothetical protein